MECGNIIFTSQLKEVKEIFLEFVSVANEINALQDSNNSFNASGSSNYSITNIGIRGNNPANNANPVKKITTACCDNGWAKVSCEFDITKPQSNPKSPFGADVSYELDINKSESNTKSHFVADVPYELVINKSQSIPKNDFGADVSHAFHINKTQSIPKNNFGDASIYKRNGYPNENVMGVEVPDGNGFDENHLEWLISEASSSSKRLINFLHYLTGDNNAHDTFDYGFTNGGVNDQHTKQREEASSSLLPLPNDVFFDFQHSEDVSVDKKTENYDISLCISNSSVETSSMPQRGFYNSNISVSEVDREDELFESKTVDIKRYRGCDNSKMCVPTSDSGPKLYCCVYCNNRYQKLERHLRFVHKNEEDVKKYLAFPPRSAPRRKILLRLLKQGDFKWNNNKDNKDGEYAVRRRPNKKFPKNPWDKIPCPRCLGAYSRSYLSRHWNNECAKNPLNGERGVLQLGRAVEGRTHPDASEDLVDLFAKFRENENIRYIRFDWLVICYGNDLCLNHSPHYQQSYICGKLRAAGKVLSTSKLLSTEISDMSSLFNVKHCNTVVDAIRIMGKFDRQTKRFGSPGTASTTVTLINAIGELLVIEAMKSDDTAKERAVERFLKVFQKDVKTKINKLVAVTKAENQRHKNDNIPTTADVNKFAKYLDSERDECFSQLAQKYSYKVWLKTSQLTMISILVYNRRRAGEMQNLLMEDFQKREIVAHQCDMLLDTIPDAAKQKIKSRMQVRNKLGKTKVPILLKHKWDDCLELLIRHREEVGIPESNNFLFAIPTSLGSFRTNNACTLMRSLSLLCGAENPSSLRGTNLRKHMASYCSTKELSDNDISNVAEFMGHAEAVHRAYYRINPLTNQVGKMSFLLDSAEGNDSTSDSEGDSDEYESDIELEAAIHFNKTRKTARKTNKDRKKSAPAKKKRNMKPKCVSKARKKTTMTTEIKMKREVKSKGVSQTRKKTVMTKTMKQKIIRKPTDNNKFQS